MAKKTNVFGLKTWYEEGSFIPEGGIVFSGHDYVIFMECIRDDICQYGRISVGVILEIVSGWCPGGQDIKIKNEAYKWIWTSPADFGYERVQKGEPRPTDTWRLVANDPIYE